MADSRVLLGVRPPIAVPPSLLRDESNTSGQNACSRRAVLAGTGHLMALTAADVARAQAPIASSRAQRPRTYSCCPPARPPSAQASTWTRSSTEKSEQSDEGETESQVAVLPASTSGARSRWPEGVARGATRSGRLGTHVPPTSSPSCIGSDTSAPICECKLLSSSRLQLCGEGSGSSRMGSCMIVGIDGRRRAFGGIMPNPCPPLGKLWETCEGAETCSPANEGRSWGAAGCGGGWASPAATFLSYAFSSPASISPP